VARSEKGGREWRGRGESAGKLEERQRKRRTLVVQHHLPRREVLPILRMSNIDDARDEFELFPTPPSSDQYLLLFLPSTNEGKTLKRTFFPPSLCCLKTPIISPCTTKLKSSLYPTARAEFFARFFSPILRGAFFFPAEVEEVEVKARREAEA
jgi:hypothetical protein